MFTWFELRAPDVAAAQKFYATILGCDAQADHEGVFLTRGGEAVAELSVLPDEARRRGAPAHWLGHLLVDDLDAAQERLKALGGEQRGPVRIRPHGSRAAFRDPYGAMVALSTDATRRSRAVAWHDLHVRDDEPALEMYASLFGWHPTEVVDLPNGIGPYRTFSWRAGERPCGAALSIKDRQTVHPHWAFYFSVADLAAACKLVAAHSGEVFFGPCRSPLGPQVAVCHDPQGAEFSLCESSNEPS